MISKDEITRISAKTDLELMVADKDYAITWLLKGIYTEPSLKNKLVFKGGTALQKVYFPDIWRYSEDLDFTYKLEPDEYDKNIKDPSAIPNEIKAGFESAFKRLKEESGIEFSFDQYKPIGRFSATANFSAIDAKAQFTGPLQHKNTINIDISLTEDLILKPVSKKVKSNYPDVKDFDVLVYDLRELLAEKIRSIMQRGKSRDYYDVWRLLKEWDFDLTEIIPLLSHKFGPTVIDFKFKPEMIFDNTKLNEAEAYWEEGLGRLTKELPEFETVKTELRQMIQLEGVLNELKDKKFDKSSRKFARFKSADALARMAPLYPNIIKTAIRILIEMLDDPYPKIATEAARLLGDLAQSNLELNKEAQKAIPKLKRMEHDRDLGVQLQAGITLGILEKKH